MSLQPEEGFEIPVQTAEVAHAAFPNGNNYMKLRDELGVIFKDEQFAILYPRCGQPAEAPWRLALVTLMQFMEDMTDREAADAVRSRIDWKYALGLELSDEGFHYSILSEFRTRLLEGHEEALLFNTLLDLFRAKKWFKERSRQRTDSTYILAAVRTLNRIELVAQTLYYVLDLLAQVAPDWLKEQISPDWFERYSQRPTDYRFPRSETERLALAVTVGKDGYHLLSRIYSGQAPEFLRTIPAVETMWRIWVQNYYPEEDGVHWRKEGNLPPASRMIASPFDPEARFSTKRESIFWLGYKVHLTETCEADQPNLITHVETTPSNEQDNLALDTIQAALKEKQLLPQQHVVDAGYVSAENLVRSEREYSIDLLGPVRPDNSWQTRVENAFAITHFQIDWERKVVTCPMGKTSSNWGPGKGPRGKPTIQVQFHKKDCCYCAARERCTRSKTAPRCLTLQLQEQQLALQEARLRQRTKDFREQYAIRSGIEGTIGQAADKLGIRRSRYRGQAKTHLHHLMAASAINVKRVLDWLAGKPRSQVRLSHFAALAYA